MNKLVCYSVDKSVYNQIKNKCFWGTILNLCPDRGQSLVEWGNFRPFVHPSKSSIWVIKPGLRPSKPGLRLSQTGLRPSQPSLRMDRQMNERIAKWTDRISPHSTGLCPLLGPLPCSTPWMKVQQGKGTTDHLMPLGNLFKLYLDKIC